MQSWAKGQEAQACWEWSPGPILEGRVNKSAGLQAMGEDVRQGSLQAGRKDWTPSTHLPSLDVHGDQLQSYGPQDGSCTEFYKDTLFGLEGGAQGMG